MQTIEIVNKWSAHGHTLMREFYNNSGLKSKMSYEKMISELQRRPNQKNFVRVFGGTAIDLKLNDALEAMRNLGKKANGRLPERNSYFTQALTDKLSEFSFIDASSFVAIESAKDIAKGAQKVGESVIQTGKLLTNFMPFIVVGGLILFLYLFIKNKAGAK